MPPLNAADSSRKQVVMSLEPSFGTPPGSSPSTITGATNAAPIVLAIAAHPFSTGQVIDVASVGGNTNANGRWQINVVDANSVALIGSQGNAAYTSGGTATPAAWVQDITDESLKHDAEKKRSSTIRSDRQKGASILMKVSQSGGTSHEWKYKELDWVISMALQNVWTVYGHRGVGAVFDGTVSGQNTITAASAPTGASAFTLLKKGQFLLLSGFSNAANNIPVQISRTTAPTSTVLVLEGTPLANGANGAACRVASSRISNGTIKMSVAIERQFTDIAQIIPFSGAMVDQLTFDYAAGDFLMVSATWKGKKGAAMVTSTQLAAAAAAQTYGEMSGVTGVSKLQRDGTTLTETLLKMQISIANGLREQLGLGILGAAGMGAGDVEVTGTQEAYLQDGTRFGLYVNNTPFGSTIAALDSSNNGYVIQVPRCVFKDANPGGGAGNADVTDPGAFEAEWDRSQTAGSGYDKTIFIDRIGVAV